MKSKVIIITIVAIIAIIALVGVSAYLSFNDTEYVVTVVKTERINDNDDSKYLIFCETENGESIVFENTDSILRGKFDSSDIYAKLQSGKKYKFTVVGIRIKFLSVYQNIIHYEELDN